MFVNRALVFDFDLAELLRVIRETENDDLTGVMQKLISTYGDQEQVASIALDIAKDLVRIRTGNLLFPRRNPD